ncbi:MAG: trigger factor [Sedimentisphaerales bacterium]|nr:trigger factor [Sedimentisphaerales bacterium]
MAEEQQATELKNTVTIEEAGPCKKRVSVEIPEEAVKKAVDKQYETLRKEALVPGFRKGRAPRRLLEKRFGKETSEQIKLKLLADASDSAIKDNKLDTLREPNVDFEKIELPDSGPLKFDFEVEVRPEFELPELKGIAVEKKKFEVADEQVDREIEQLQKYAGLWSPRQEGETVELDDQIIADVVLKAQGAEQEQKLDNVEIYVRRNGFVGAIAVEKLDELLVGAKAEEIKKITVEVPKTYFREEYRGKKVDIEIAIKDIKWLKLAELNEDFFRRFGVENEGQLREKLRDGLRSRLEQQVQADMAEQIYKYMLNNTKLDLPTDIVAEQSASLLQRQYINLLQRGLTREQIEEHMEQLRAGSEQQAAEQLKTFFIMDKVADKLGVEVSEEEINGYIAQLAVQRGQRPERMREQMVRDGSLSQLRLQVRENKCIAKLLESAKITEVELEKKPKKAGAKAVKKTAMDEKKQPKKRKVAAKKKTDK